MASGGVVCDVSDMISESDEETGENFVDRCNLSVNNRFEQRQNGGENNNEGFRTVKSKKRKKGSNGSIDSFAGMKTDDKLTCIFDNVNRNYDKITELETEQRSYREEVKTVTSRVNGLDSRVRRMEEMFEAQRWQSKVLSYKSIDRDARDMRNNIVIYGLTERIRRDSRDLVFDFLENELEIDTSEMRIERAHRMGKLTDRRINDAKRPMVVRFRDYIDTETILNERN